MTPRKKKKSKEPVENPGWNQRRKTRKLGRFRASEVKRSLKKLRERLSADAIRKAEELLEQYSSCRKKKGDLHWKEFETVVENMGQMLEKELAEAKKGNIRQAAESIAWAGVIALFIRFFLIEPFMIPTGSMIPTLLIDDHIFVSKCAYGIQIPFMNSYLVKWDEPTYGDVVVFPFPVEGHPDYGKDFIKRVIGLPGDKVKLKNNRLMIVKDDGTSLEFSTEQDSETSDCKFNDTICKCYLQHETLGGRSYVSRHLADTQNGFFCRRNEAYWPVGDERNLQDGSRLDLSEFVEEGYFVVPQDQILVMGDNRDNSSDGRAWGTVPADTIKGSAQFIWYATDLSRIFSGVR